MAPPVPNRVFLHSLQDPPYLPPTPGANLMVTCNGLVVELIQAGSAQFRKPWSYILDDGTAQVKVNHFIEPNDERPPITFPGSSPMERLVNSLAQKPLHPMKLGQCIEIRGKVNVFRGRAEINIYSIKRVQPSHEVDMVKASVNMAKMYQKAETKAIALADMDVDGADGGAGPSKKRRV